jgi:hypothetical protein
VPHVTTPRGQGVAEVRARVTLSAGDGRTRRLQGADMSPDSAVVVLPGVARRRAHGHDGRDRGELRRDVDPFVGSRRDVFGATLHAVTSVRRSARGRVRTEWRSRGTRTFTTRSPAVHRHRATEGNACPPRGMRSRPPSPGAAERPVAAPRRTRRRARRRERERGPS